MNVISVRDVTKMYKIYKDKGSTLKEKILFRNRNRYEEKWVLKGISFDIEKGCAVGLIGENGSGKSTLLKLLTRIIYPNQGEIKIHGKVSSLLELGAGFHPDMTGRENIYTNASIFGLTKEEIDSRLEDIINFSELGEYIDNPVRTYSSGMYMRLAFSVAINVKADILLIDEILAVGDVNFQRKCYNKMRKLKRDGVTIVLVSHDLDSVEKLCDKAIWIRDGYLAEYGDAITVCRKYLQYMIEKDEKTALLAEGAEDKLGLPPSSDSQQAAQPQGEPHQAAGGHVKENVPTADSQQPRSASQRWGNGDIIIHHVSMEDAEGRERRSFTTGEPVVIKIGYRKIKDVKNLGFGIGIHRVDGVHCYGTNTFIDDFEIEAEQIQDEGEILCKIDPISLVEGTYTLDVAVHDKEGLAYDYITHILEFNVYSEIKDVGVSRLFHSWELVDKK